MTAPSALGRWQRPLCTTIVYAYVYVILEWLFFATKQSFLTRFSILDQLLVGLIAPLPIAACVAVAFGGLWAVACLAPRSPLANGLLWLSWWLPSGIAVATLLLFFDTFTYTTFGVGVRTTEGGWRAAYSLGLLACTVGVQVRMIRRSRTAPAGSVPRGLCTAAIALIGVSLVAVSVRETTCLGEDGTASATRPVQKRLPNILILSGDGLDADSLSAYRYDRATTPFLDSIKDQALICENALANASATAPSITAMLTGKLPTRTRLIYAPDILVERDSYEHLPGILRSLGYRSLSITDRIHADVSRLNFRNAFDRVNFRGPPGGIEQTSGLDRLFRTSATSCMGARFASELYFHARMRERISNRILHLLWIRDMEDPMAEVVDPEQQSMGDAERITAVLDFIDVSEPPIFVHAHLYGTHGPLYASREAVFKADDAPSYSTEAYDDAILDFDRYMRQIFEHLKRAGGLEDWLIVVTSDHGKKWRSNRVPLLFFFPRAAPSGIRVNNCQLLDIAPTVLDAVGVPVPEWMQGRSLLVKEPDPLRPSFRIIPGAVEYDPETQEVWKHEQGPPFHGMAFLSVTICHKNYRMNLALNEQSMRVMERYRAKQTGVDPQQDRKLHRSGRITVLPVKGHTGPCDPKELPTPLEAQEILTRHLESNGYDTSGL